MVGGSLSVPGYTGKCSPSVFITYSQLYYPLHLWYLPCYVIWCYTVVVYAVGGVRTAYIMRYAHTRRCPYMRGYVAKRSKCMFSRNTTFYHRCYIYLYSLLINPFSPKTPKTKESKISPTDEFSPVDKIYTEIIIFRIFTPPSLFHAKYLE